jgi:hypothetical protein
MVLLCLFWGEAFVPGIPLNVNGLSYGVVPGSGRAGVRLFLPNSKQPNHSKLAGERIARADARLAIFIEQPHAIRRGTMTEVERLGEAGRFSFLAYRVKVPWGRSLCMAASASELCGSV